MSSELYKVIQLTDDQINVLHNMMDICNECKGSYIRGIYLK